MTKLGFEQGFCEVEGCGGTRFDKRYRCYICKANNQKTYRANMPEDQIQKYKVSNEQWVKEHTEHIRSQNKQWREDNPEYHKQYRIDNREHRAEYTKQWRLDNPEQYSESSSKWREENKDKLLEQSIIWRGDNKERIAKVGRQYQKDNPDKVLAHVHKRLARIAGNGGSHTGKQWNNVYDYFNGLCLHPECLENNLSYPLHGEGCINKDHVISLKFGGTSNIDNYQPLCGHHNKSKGKKCIDYRDDAIEYLGLDFDEYYDLMEVA